jgi:hypothetical protein
MWDGRVPCHPVEVAGLVYVEVPKAGCTSVKWALSPFKGGPPGYEDPDEMHRWFGYTYAQHTTEMRDWCGNRWMDLFRFTVVRDPIERFVSFYRDKVPAHERLVYGLNDYVLHRFPHDLERRFDIHAVPQSALLGDLSVFDHVAHTEKLEELGPVLSVATGTSVQMPHLNRTYADEELSPEAKEVLYRLYDRDFEMLA